MTAAGPENTERKQKLFRRGQSGNPSGRPVGARNRATLAMEALLDGEAEAITRKAVELAKAGDGPALRLCMERIMPARRDRPISFRLPHLEKAADAVKANAALVEAVAAGQLTPAEASELSKLVESFIRAIEVTDIQDRLAKLEAQSDEPGDASASGEARNGLLLRNRSEGLIGALEVS